MRENPKVLVVDDDQRMVKTICDILKVKGYQTEPAHSGREAVEKVRERDLDCVLMDVKMPEMDGVAALKLIKEIAPETPVVLMSAYATDEQAEEAKRQGAAAVLTKPIDFQQVLSFLSLLQQEQSILVVDDDPLFSKTLKDILQANGHHVETEADPSKVLEHMDKRPQWVVILDLKLGTADGLDVLRRVRARYPEVPVVLATGYRNEMTTCIEQGMRVGAYTCLYKPLEMDRLLKLIEDIGRRKIRSFLGDEP